MKDVVSDFSCTAIMTGNMHSEEFYEGGTCKWCKQTNVQGTKQRT